jgi:hypothetical protein
LPCYWLFFFSIFENIFVQKREKKTEFVVQKTTNSAKNSIKKKFIESKFHYDPWLMA